MARFGPKWQKIRPSSDGCTKIRNSSLKQRYRAILLLRNNKTRKSTMKEVARLRILKKMRRLLVEMSESNIFEAIDWLKTSRIFAQKFRVISLCLRMELRYWLKRGYLGIWLVRRVWGYWFDWLWSTSSWRWLAVLFWKSNEASLWSKIKHGK